MLDAFGYPLCLKLCWHNRKVPNKRTYVRIYYIATYVNIIIYFLHFIVYNRKTSSGVPDDDFVNISDVFKEPVTIANAYIVLCEQLETILKYCDLLTLKKALIRQSDTPDGVELGEDLKKRIKMAESIPQLLNILEESKSYNWLDTRLIETLAYGSKSSNAVELIKAYQKVLFPRKLLDVLPKKLELVQTKQQYVDAVKAKTEIDPTTITVKDFIDYRWKIENVILDLGRGILNLEHVEIGCLEISYLIPVHYTFNAYKMSLHNYDKFNEIDLLYIEIGDYPLIYDPWISGLEKRSVKEIVHARQGKVF